MGDCYRAQSLKLNFRDNSVGYDTDLVITQGMCRWVWVDEKIIKSEEIQGLRGEDIDGCLLGMANLINYILHKSIHYLTKHTEPLTTFMVLFPTKTNQSTPQVLHSNHRNILSPPPKYTVFFLEPRPLYMLFPFSYTRNSLLPRLTLLQHIFLSKYSVCLLLRSTRTMFPMEKKSH